MAKKKRRAPRKRAVTKAQVSAQLARYNKLLGNWITKSEQALARVRKYRQKVEYYQQRYDAMTAVEREEAEARLRRELRSIQLREHADV